MKARTSIINLAREHVDLLNYNLKLNKIPKWFRCILELENHWPDQWNSSLFHRTGSLLFPRQHLSNFLSFSLMFPRRLPQLWISRLHITFEQDRKSGFSFCVSFWQGGISFTKSPKANLWDVIGPCLVIPLARGMKLSRSAKMYQHSFGG